MVRAIVDSNSYMTSTADADWVPWASPVWYAAASYREFFWVSKPGARHSQNIAARPEVGSVIFDSTVPISTGKAVYMAARAEEVTAAREIERGMSIFSRRSLEQGGREWTPDDVGSSGAAAPLPRDGVGAVPALAGGRAVALQAGIADGTRKTSPCLPV